MREILIWERLCFDLRVMTLVPPTSCPMNKRKAMEKYLLQTSLGGCGQLEPSNLSLLDPSLHTRIIIWLICESYDKIHGNTAANIIRFN